MTNEEVVSDMYHFWYGVTKGSNLRPPALRSRRSYHYATAAVWNIETQKKTREVIDDLHRIYVIFYACIIAVKLVVICYYSSLAPPLKIYDKLLGKKRQLETTAKFMMNKNINT